MKPLLLDLFCGAGGAGSGYEQAGFDVFGIDINPQPNYPFDFLQYDALDIMSMLSRFVQYNLKGRPIAAIHASPPCQAHTAMKYAPNARKHVSLVDPTRKLLENSGLPYVIENVVGAPLTNPITLCGSMFRLRAGDFRLQRHRLFESNQRILPPPPCVHEGPTIGIYGGHVRCRSAAYWRNGGADFPGQDKKALAMQAMGIEHFMTMNEISEAIPPAYSKWIGQQLMKEVS